MITASAFAGAAQAQTGQVPEDPQTTDEAPSDIEEDVTPADADGAQDTRADEIVVTGSRISRPTLSSVVPITSVTGADLLATGNVNLGDALADLPALRGTYTQSNSTRFIFTTGLSLLDLRGLGTARTLVLVNGRRHVTSVPGTSTVDAHRDPRNDDRQP